MFIVKIAPVKIAKGALILIAAYVNDKIISLALAPVSVLPDIKTEE